MKQTLRGVRVVDLSANAPGPYASRILADLGAEVTCIIKPAGAPCYAAAEDDPMLAGRRGEYDALARGKATEPMDLKSDSGRAQLLERLQQCDVLISEMRPGKMEALGLGWEELSAHNPRLIVCEITGYGRTHSHAARAGHDINYLALSGALSLLRDRQGAPVPPQNFVGDYGAGGSFAVMGILAALLEREHSGKGKHLTISMTEGIRYLMADIAAATLLAGAREESWRDTLIGGMPTYRTYRTADGQWLAVGALEPKFIVQLSEVLQWPELQELMARKATWEEARSGLAQRFAERPLAEWEAMFAARDACVTPVRALAEAGGLPTFSQVCHASPAPPPAEE